MKLKTTKSDAESIISNAQGEVDTLKDELQSWFDNLPESFQNGIKGDALQEAIDGLDSSNVDSLKMPEFIGNLDGGFEVEVPTRRVKSRADRAGLVAEQMRALAEAIRERADESRQLQIDIDEERELRKKNEGSTEPDMSDMEQPKWNDDRVQEAETFADEVESAAEQLENVMFPGMYS